MPASLLPALLLLPALAVRDAVEPLRREAFAEAVRSSQRRLARGLDLRIDHGTWDDPFEASSPSYAVASHGRLRYGGGRSRASGRHSS